MKNSYYHLYAPDNVESRFELLVFDEQGVVFLPLTEFYHEQKSKLSKSSALSYLSHLEKYFRWLDTSLSFQRRRTEWNEAPDIIRYVVEKYLYEEMGCRVRHKNNSEFQFVYTSAKSPSTVNHFLAAIKAFYRCMIQLKFYNFSNPLVDENYQINDVLSKNSSDREKPRMPAISGIEEPIKNARRLTDSYFKLLNQEWKPIIVSDINLPHYLYRAGEEINWSLRDEVIVRLLFETGARISEILELTIHDYRSKVNLYELSTFNKGSDKKRVKYLRMTPETAKLFLKYINYERSKSLKSKTKLIHLKDDDRIFLTQKGQAYNYNAFYFNWTKIIKVANIQCNPHKIRHWFVTNMIRSIYETSKTESEIAEKINDLIHYMKWKSPETIEVYKHHFSESRYRDLHEQLFNSLNAIPSNQFATSIKDNKRIDSPSTNPIWLNEFMEGIDDE
ncbi:tyrosine-type recombinase/integrase [Paenibacillus campi]|uniref:tyrosine-type recombinase/integrase n=1 Tax=Paenibacillus campi TaxID=3106031 RepID=UPI002AFEA4F2|nr:tyrosine-type recombinase/integrase [Paenibacillus sp. SGZ-1014]